MNHKQKIQNIFEGFMSMQKAMSSRKDLFLKQFELTVPQMHILYSIAQGKTLTVKDIATKMGITSSAATQIIQGLVKSGYVERKNDDRDGRVIHIQFSKEGQLKFKKFREAHLERISKIFASLTDQELDLLIEIPKKVLLHANQLDNNNL